MRSFTKILSIYCVILFAFETNSQTAHEVNNIIQPAPLINYIQPDPTTNIQLLDEYNNSLSMIHLDDTIDISTRRRLRSCPNILYERRHRTRPRKGHRIKTINIEDNMIISFDVQINRWPRSTWGNIIHCGSRNTIRQPGLWVNKHKYFHVVYGTKRNWNKLKNKHRIRLRKKYKFEFRIRRNRYDVYIDGRRFHSVRGTHHNHRNQPCYLSDPWHEAANGYVSNLKIIRGSDPGGGCRSKGEHPLLKSLPLSSFTSNNGFHAHCRDPRFNSGTSWCTKHHAGNRRSSTYLQVNFNRIHSIRAIATKGRANHGQWVKRYKLQYSIDGRRWRSKGTYSGNYDRNTVVKHSVNIRARSLRFIPVSYHGWKSMRIEAYGKGNKRGRGNKQLLQSLRLSSFKSNDGFHAHCRDPRLNSGTSWCTKHNRGNRRSNTYLQANLGRVKLIKVIGTKGRGNHGQWVKRYKLQYSKDGRRWRSKGILSGNYDKNTEVTHRVNIRAKYIRFTPVSYHGWKSMRIEAYGSNYRPKRRKRKRKRRRRKRRRKKRKRKKRKRKRRRKVRKKRRKRRKKRYGKWKCTHSKLGDRYTKQCIRMRSGASRRRFNRMMRRWYRRMKRRGYSGFSGLGRGFKRGYSLGKREAMRRMGRRPGFNTMNKPLGLTGIGGTLNRRENQESQLIDQKLRQQRRARRRGKRRNRNQLENMLMKDMQIKPKVIKPAPQIIVEQKRRRSGRSDMLKSLVQNQENQMGNALGMEKQQTGKIMQQSNNEMKNLENVMKMDQNKIDQLIGTVKQVRGNNGVMMGPKQVDIGRDSYQSLYKEYLKKYHMWYKGARNLGPRPPGVMW